MRLTIDHVSKRLAGRRVVDDVFLECRAGEVVAVVGPNGAGKSTLLRCVSGVSAPDDGAVLIEGTSVHGLSHRGRRNIGYVPESADPPPHLTCAELIDWVRALKSAGPLPDAVRDKLRLDHLQAKRIDAMSLGERRRTCLGAALVGPPKLLILDEPTNGLDQDAWQALAEVLGHCREDDMTVLVATHDREFTAAIGARIVELRNGRLVREAPEPH